MRDVSGLRGAVVLAVVGAVVAGCGGGSTPRVDRDEPRNLATITPVRDTDASKKRRDPTPEEEDADAAGVALPAFGPFAWQRFTTTINSASRFAIDTTSLRVDPDGVVRYALRVTPPSGVDNLTFEGIDCDRGRWRVFATAGSVGPWSRARGRWAGYLEGSADRPRETLARRFVCEPSGAPVRTPQAIVAKLKHAERNPIDPSMR